MPKLISPKVKDYIITLAAQGYSSADIIAQMETEKSLYGCTLPAARTVQHLVKQWRQKDTSETWTLDDCDNPDDAQIVLAHLAYSAEWASKHGLPFPKFSRQVADKLIRVHRAAPTIPLWLGWNVAIGLLHGENAEYWHLLLATRAWESEEANRRFYDLAKAFFGPPIGDGNDREEYHRRYPLGVTPFYLPKENYPD